MMGRRRSPLSNNTTKGNPVIQADLGVDIRYQLDWWGKQRASIDAALDRARAAMVEQRATMLALSAAVAAEYFGWQSDAARLTLAEQRLQLLQSQRQLAARKRCLVAGHQRAGHQLRPDPATFRLGLGFAAPDAAQRAASTFAGATGIPKRSPATDRVHRADGVTLTIA